MGRNPYKHYSAYNRKTDMPVIIHGTTRECMRALGVSESTFYCYVTHTRTGRRKCKYEIYVDEEGEDD